MKTSARTKKAHDADLIQRELDELGRECARVTTLLRRLAKARAVGADVEDILGELGGIVVHLHAHTDGLDELIDRLA